MTGEKITAKRWELGMSQYDFWRRVGTSQACGSRYEAGRAIPAPIRTLLDLVYFLPPSEAVERLRGMRK